MYGTNITVEVHADRVVISNPGGIPEGVDIKSLIGGVSMRRNELIADIFARMDKVERMGSGLKRIGDIMKEAGQTYPEIESNLFFHITFKRPFYSEPKTKVSPKVLTKPSEKKLDDTAKVILLEIQKNPHITAKELAEVLGLTLRAIEKQLSNLKADGIIERAGSRKTGFWKINV